MPLQNPYDLGGQTGVPGVPNLPRRRPLWPKLGTSVAIQPDIYRSSATLLEVLAMAEIPIERKPRRSVSPLLLILLIIVIVGAVWYWWTNKNATPATTGSVTPIARIASVSVPASFSSHLRRA